MHFAAYKTFASKQSVQFALKRSVNVTPRLISIANFWWRHHKGILWSSLFISLCVHSKDKQIRMNYHKRIKHFVTVNVMKPVN